MTDYDSQILLLSPDGYWKLDETSGLVFADSSGAGNSLTAGVGAVENWAIPGPSATMIPVACDFLNVNPPAAAVGTLGQRAIGASFSVEAWIGSVGSIPTNFSIFSKGYRGVEQRPWYSLGLNAGGQPHWWFRNAAGTDYQLIGSGNVSDASYTNRGPFHHIVGTYTAGTADLYVDGVHQGTLAVPNTGWGTGVQPAGLGQLAGGIWGGPWLADVAIYPGQLSAAQVLSNYNLGITGSPRTIRDIGDVLTGLQGLIDKITEYVSHTYQN